MSISYMCMLTSLTPLPSTSEWEYRQTLALAPKKPHAACNKTVREWKEDGILCDGCNMWYHLRCTGLTEDDFQRFVHTIDDWYVYIYKLP